MAATRSKDRELEGYTAFFWDIVNVACVIGAKSWTAGDAEAKPQGRQVPSFRWTDFQRCAGKILRIIMVYQSDFRFWICFCSPISWRNLCQNATTSHNASTRPQSNPVGAPVVELPLTSPPQKYQKVMDLWRYTVSILTKQLSDRISDKRSAAFFGWR